MITRRELLGLAAIVPAVYIAGKVKTNPKIYRLRPPCSSTTDRIVLDELVNMTAYHSKDDMHL